MGRKGAPMDILALKRLSCKFKDGRERFGLGASRRVGAKAETFVSDEMVGCGRRWSGSAGGRTAVEAIVAAVSATSKIEFIFTLDEDLSPAIVFLENGSLGK